MIVLQPVCNNARVRRMIMRKIGNEQRINERKQDKRMKNSTCQLCSLSDNDFLRNILGICIHLSSVFSLISSICLTLSQPIFCIVCDSRLIQFPSASFKKSISFLKICCLLFVFTFRCRMSIKIVEIRSVIKLLAIF